MFEEMKAPRFDSVGEPEVESTALETSCNFVVLRNTLPSYIVLISAVVDQLMSFISGFRGADGNNFEIELALREALVNAIVHGNREDPNKNVHIDCRCTKEGEVSITVVDEGLGFEYDAVADPTSPDNRLLTHGRGIYLMRTLMDEVDFEQRGSVVRMRKGANAASATARKPK